MKMVLVSKCSLDIEQYVEFQMSVLISPSKSLISLRWVTFVSLLHCHFVMVLLGEDVFSLYLFFFFFVIVFLFIKKTKITKKIT